MFFYIQMCITTKKRLYNASLLVRAAIKLLMKTFPFMLWNAGTWGLVVRGVLIFEDAAGEAGIGVDGWFAVLEVSPNRTRVERFFGCCDGMVILLARFDRVIGPFFYCQGLVVSWEIAKEKAKRNEWGRGGLVPEGINPQGSLFISWLRHVLPYCLPIGFAAKFLLRILKLILKKKYMHSYGANLIWIEQFFCQKRRHTWG